jgi:5'-3' exoribonuclease 1
VFLPPGRFYRWLSERYPLINQAVDDTTLLPEFDALYLDMNGLIHNSTHGNEGVSKKLDEKDLMLTMFASIDFMVKTIKPRRLLYMAIDGCAPRAKMNQQRSRRFRAARDLAEARREAAGRGEVHSDEDVFDSNCITPGTEFMEAVSQYMQYFVRKKLKEDPLWQRMEVVYSGHDVPGEGEHKIVQYIRAAKLDPAYDPNTRHCMAGLDADLIMLGLATHEPHFSLLREQVDFNSFRKEAFATKTKVS